MAVIEDNYDCLARSQGIQHCPEIPSIPWLNELKD